MVRAQTPIKVPAIEYVNYLMEWVDSQIETVFPKTPGEPFGDDFMSAAKTIFKRLFRVYAHMYHSHFRVFTALGCEAHLNICFKRFAFFVIELAGRLRTGAPRPPRQPISSSPFSPAPSRCCDTPPCAGSVAFAEARRKFGALGASPEELRLLLLRRIENSASAAPANVPMPLHTTGSISCRSASWHHCRA